MARGKKRSEQEVQQQELFNGGAEPAEGGGDDEEVVLEGTLVCALTGEHRLSTPQEEVLQSFIEQLHREYGIALEDMERDVRIACESSEDGKVRTRNRTVSLVVFEPRARHRDAEDAIDVKNVTRVVIVAKPGTKPDDKAIGLLEEVLGSLSEDRPEVYGVWTNGADLAFRMRTFHKRSGQPEYTELTDIPAPDETLADLESAERRPLRIAAGDSLLRTFKRCHDYLYGNQNMRGDRAFWQLLYLIFAKILDERSTSREFFVGATERNAEAGQKRISQRIKKLFDRVKDEYGDVFEGNEKIELNDRALAFIAGELSRYSLLSTDTDAKGMAYEAITSTTLKRERGQFFTPRNVIRMMVDMVDPQPGKRVLDPACGSGGFLVVALAHARRAFLAQSGCPYPDQPVPKELKRVDPKLRDYAKKCLYGIDVDPELRKAARMNMVMNNDGHGNIFSFNSLEFGIPKLMSEEMEKFAKATGGHGGFDYVFTDPPFGAKIPVEDRDIVSAFELGHVWRRSEGKWIKGEVQKKVSPEILFIECCYNFLKQGTGVMAIVLPNGILGNPGEQMEFVRWWMLQRMELLASVDLPAEAFLPQVSVQASCVLLRRRYASEHQQVGKEGLKQRPVFMAIAEKCGHGRRGDVTYERNPDGTDLVVSETVMERFEHNGRIEERQRIRQAKRIADDMPWVASKYTRFVAGEPLDI
ncbi:N-6 DNA methylase [Sorangium cellulosum]|uniref:N-6 DNA methylase n=1 Tax=Sorangium cellulosum TaxID=56 RepID=A0A4P2Q374_SORCE|nr:N-6 DNA methylase [Sorangium cellulosum]AUX23767.1 N-6 DNA methylase [Sorangium cellulosum]